MEYTKSCRDAQQRWSALGVVAPGPHGHVAAPEPHEAMDCEAVLERAAAGAGAASDGLAVHRVRACAGTGVAFPFEFPRAFRRSGGMIGQGVPLQHVVSPLREFACPSPAAV